MFIQILGFSPSISCDKILWEDTPYGRKGFSWLMVPDGQGLEWQGNHGRKQPEQEAQVTVLALLPVSTSSSEAPPPNGPIASPSLEPARGQVFTNLSL